MTNHQSQGVDHKRWTAFKTNYFSNFQQGVRQVQYNLWRPQQENLSADIAYEWGDNNFLWDPLDCSRKTEAQ